MRPLRFARDCCAQNKKQINEKLLCDILSNVPSCTPYPFLVSLEAWVGAKSGINWIAEYRSYFLCSPFCLSAHRNDDCRFWKRFLWTVRCGVHLATFAISRLPVKPHFLGFVNKPDKHGV